MFPLFGVLLFLYKLSVFSQSEVLSRRRKALQQMRVQTGSSQGCTVMTNMFSHWVQEMSNWVVESFLITLNWDYTAPLVEIEIVRVEMADKYIVRTSLFFRQHSSDGHKGSPNTRKWITLSIMCEQIVQWQWVEPATVAMLKG